MALTYLKKNSSKTLRQYLRDFFNVTSLPSVLLVLILSLFFLLASLTPHCSFNLFYLPFLNSEQNLSIILTLILSLLPVNTYPSCRIKSPPSPQPPTIKPYLLATNYLILIEFELHITFFIVTIDQIFSVILFKPILLYIFKILNFFNTTFSCCLIFLIFISFKPLLLFLFIFLFNRVFCCYATLYLEYSCYNALSILNFNCRLNLVNKDYDFSYCVKLKPNKISDFLKYSIMNDNSFSHNGSFALEPNSIKGLILLPEFTSLSNARDSFISVADYKYAYDI